MAKGNVNQSASVRGREPASSGGIPAAAMTEIFQLRDIVSSHLHFAVQVSTLAEWVISATQLIDRIDHASDRNQDLNECLKLHDIHTIRAVWDEEQSEALQHLLMEQSNRLTGALDLIDNMPGSVEAVCNV